MLSCFGCDSRIHGWFFNYALHQFFRRQLHQIFLPIGILDVQIITVPCDLLRRNPPGPFALGPVLPPGQAVGELLELQGLGLGVLLPSLRQGQLIVPDLLGRPGAIEEEQIGGNIGIGCKDAVGQPYNGEFRKTSFNR